MIFLSHEQQKMYLDFRDRYGIETAERYKTVCLSKPNKEPKARQAERLQKHSGIPPLLQEWNVPLDVTTRPAIRDEFDTISFALAENAIALIQEGYFFTLKDVAERTGINDSAFYNRPILREWVQNKGQWLPTRREVQVKEAIARIKIRGDRLNTKTVSVETGIPYSSLRCNTKLVKLIEEA